MRLSGVRGAIDHGKLLVWGFAAGFSERLVPSALDNLTTTKAVRPQADLLYGGSSEGKGPISSKLVTR